MRQINAQPEPIELSQFRAQYQNDINFGYDLIDKNLRAVIKARLIRDQKGLCAYTGLSINEERSAIGSLVERSHIEHLLPQDHCTTGVEDVAYNNMVGCFPEPDGPWAPFGAHPKQNWPSRPEEHLFVSPRSNGCEARFEFDLKGRINAAENDDAASETIKRLVLNHDRLVALRRAAIEATLVLRGKNASQLDLASARRRLAGLEAAEVAEARLEPFCFALKQSLRKHIRKLEHIRDSKRRINK